MLRNMIDIEGFAIQATDGILGHVKDFYFDDESWVVRYFVVETGLWHANRRTLISPMAMGIPNWPEKLIPASLTQEQVRNSPDIDTDKPVPRQHQASVIRRKNDLNLRSANSVLRSYVHATDGDIGHVAGILVEEETWAIRYMIVNTSNWWLGHEVLIAPEWVEDVYWAESKLMLALTRQAIKNAPEYNSLAPITREHEKLLHAFHGRPGYWPDESAEGGDVLYV
jgi:hypothetical protein